MDYLWSEVADGSDIVFDSERDRLLFDAAAISTADVFLDLSVSGETTLSYGSSSVTLLAAPATLASSNFVFDGGGVLQIGGNDTLTGGDDSASSQAGTTVDDLPADSEGGDTHVGGIGGLFSALLLPGGGGSESALTVDGVPLVSVDSVVLSEGDSGGSYASFSVTLSETPAGTVQVQYQTVEATARAGSDYVGASGTLTFTSGGSLTQSVDVYVLGDTTWERDEAFLLDLHSASGLVIGDGLGVATIGNDDGQAQLSITDVTLPEGGVAFFTVNLSSPSGEIVAVDYALTEGTATAGTDYTDASGTLYFLPGQTAATLLVRTHGDTEVESHETFEVTLSNAVGAVINDDAGTGTLVNDDGAVVILVDDVVLDEGAGSATFNVILNQASSETVTVDVETADGTAQAGSDYTAVSTTTLTFEPGETVKQVVVSLSDDALDEFDESFRVNLSNASGDAFIADGQGVATLTDNDATPTVSIADVTVAEGDAGTTDAQFTVTLSEASGKPVTVVFASADLTARAGGGDYAANAGTLTIAAGDTEATVTVAVSGDTLDEIDEAFLVNLTSAANADISDAQGTATITDDDGLPIGLLLPGGGGSESALTVDGVPLVSVDSVVLSEGDSGGSYASFSVTLSETPAGTVQVQYQTVEATARAGSDYVGASGTLTFTSGGSLTQSVDVYVLGDTTWERDEAFLLDLHSASGLVIGDGLGVATIGNDDGQAQLSITDVTLPEGGVAFFTVNLSSPSGEIVAVDYALTEGTATAGTDYTDASGTLYFLPGQTAATLLVRTHGDTEVESHETFEVTLSNAVGAVINDDAGTGTLVNDDGAVVILVDDVVLDEGAGSATFNVILNQASSETVTVDVETADGTAQAGSDYTAVSTTTLTFEPGETVKQVVVSLSDDALDEFDESFRVNLSNASGDAFIADGQGVATLTDNDATPTVSIADVTVAEGDAGTTDAQFTVTLSEASGKPVTVVFASADLTARAGGGDYAANAGTLTIAAGDTEATVTVAVSGDTLDEIDEAFLVNLTSAANADISDAQGTATITDDDGLPIGLLLPGGGGSESALTVDGVPLVSVDSVVLSEGDSGGSYASFSVTLSEAPAGTVQVQYQTVEATARAGSDYVGASGTLTFTSGGSLTQSVDVYVLGDTTWERDEAFLLDLHSASGLVIGDGLGVATIGNDDGQAQLSITDVTLPEGGVAFFTVNLSSPSGEIVAVDYALTEGTATAGTDYTDASGTLYFLPGQTAATLLVRTHGDTEVESHETFEVTLSNAVGAVINDDAGTGTLVNDDGAVVILVNDVVLDEGAGSATFNVILNQASSETVTVDVETADGTAQAGSDYTAVSTTTLTFEPGETVKQVVVSLGDDALDEFDESFRVNLSNASGDAFIADGQGVATLTDNDATPTVSIADVTVAEGDAGTTDAQFTVTLSEASGKPVTVVFASADLTARAGGGDYAANAGTLTIAAGDTEATVTVAVSGDTLDEIDEAFLVNLTSAANADISDAQGTATITDDDPYTLIIGTPGPDALLGTTGADETSGIDWIVGLGGADTMQGLPGNDTLEGGSGVDSLLGGQGDDTYLTSSTGTAGVTRIVFQQDVIVESSGDGLDTVYSLSSYSLSEYVENLVLVGSAFWRPYTGTGNELANHIVGAGTARYRLFGGGGDDSLVGGVGADRLDGGAGNDVIDYAGGGADTLEGGADNDLFINIAFADQVAVLDGGMGSDTIHPGGAMNLSQFGPANSIEYITAALIFGMSGNDVIDLSATVTPYLGGIDGMEGADTITGTAAADLIKGNAGADRLDGGSGADTLIGGAEADLVRGGAGDDVIDFTGGGADTLEGGADNDLFINIAFADQVAVLDGGMGSDTIHPGGAMNLSQFGPANSIEYITAALIFGMSGNDVIDLSATVTPYLGGIYGMEGADAITGTTAADFIEGNAGADTLDGGSGADTLIGGTEADIVRGGAGDDVIDFTGGGADTLEGGADNDLFINIAFADQVAVLDGGMGSDTIHPGGAMNLSQFGPANSIEYITAALIFGMSGNDVIDLSATVTPYLGGIDGMEGADTITGTAAADLIKGNAGADRLDGGSGADTLIGGAEADLVRGGAGDDVIDFTGGGADTLEGGADNDLFINIAFADQVAVLDGGMGSDTIHPGGAMNLSQFGPANSIEYITAALIFGMSGNDVIDLSATVTPYLGGIYGMEGADAITGTTAADFIEGNAGADTLDGGSGADTLIGGTEADIVRGGAGDDVIDFTGGGADTLEGGADNDLFINIAFADQVAVLDGGMGSDTIHPGGAMNLSQFGPANSIEYITAALIFGMSGNDVIDLSATVTPYLGGIYGMEGADAITGTTAADFIEGNAGADTLDGGSGADTLIGGAEADLVRGGADADVFLFNAAPDTDTVLDFSSGSDRIFLDDAIFSAFTPGAVTAQRVQVGLESAISATSGNDADGLDNLKYATDTGHLYYDSNGTSAGGLNLIATLYSTGATAATLLPAQDIVIV